MQGAALVFLYYTFYYFLLEHGTNLLIKEQVRSVSMNAGRIVLLIFGILFALAAFGLIIGGGAILAIDRSFKDDQGYYMTGFRQLETDSRLIVSQPAQIHMQTRWNRTKRNPVTLKVEAHDSNNAKAVFIGIARTSALSPYLKGYAYDEITGFDFNADSIELSPRTGSTGPSLPNTPGFWTASVSGTGTQTLLWDLASGDYSLVIMNADGSAPINTQVSIGAKLPAIVDSIGPGLLGGGIVLLIISGVMIYFAVRR
jgi:hypothetical protein